MDVPVLKNDRLGEAVVLSTGTSIPAQCCRRCRATDGGDAGDGGSVESTSDQEGHSRLGLPHVSAVSLFEKQQGARKIGTGTAANSRTGFKGSATGLVTSETGKKIG